MIKKTKPILYISIPLFCTLVFVIFEVRFQYTELGDEALNASEWSFSRGLLSTVIGFGIGLTIDLLLWLVTPSNRKVNG
jgi:hypothetical protein